ncbi:lamin tail domain-containing protein [Verrucomicrobiaceae bacterium N1E253]|uniref:Lamin tail domain-containing protein n=1 Tax=Oceaniferula marina TaxID=2748318 RepID=A0A851GIT6_9BACT|nr:lamin tail domain-containing protein [Oceaniferula marina]NWK56872.1 lamin tail domain-containing protein [Oceaniferula marina]
MMSRFLVLVVAWMVCWILPVAIAAGDPVISEFLASNDSEYADEDGEFSDWIEIHNPGSLAVNLAGWHLTDADDDLEKWTFPSVSVPAGGYLVVFASGKDRAVTGSELHTNFKLSSDGEYLSLVKPDGVSKTSEFDPFPAQSEDISYGLFNRSVLVASQSAVQFTTETPTVDLQGKDWTAYDFDDETWSEGMAGLGYDRSGDYAQWINSWLADGTVSVWSRQSFELPDASAVSGMILRLRYDDAVEVFLNGTEVLSSTQAGDATGFVDFDLAGYESALRNGTNVLAIQLNNSNASSSDLLLDAELSVNTAADASAYTYLSDPSPARANDGGVINPGPIVSGVTENPPQPGEADDVLVTAYVQPREAAVASVTLRYRVNYSAELEVAMRDDGLGGDVSAGDGLYTAILPASAASAGEMLRWTVVAEDTGGLASRMPMQADTSGDSQSPGYYGTVVADPSLGQDLELMHWFTQNVTNAHNRTGARASVYYGGKFYDNIYVRERGGYTNTSSQKFDFNKGYPLYVNETMPSVGEVNMNANGSDPSYLRQPLGFQYHQQAGNPACESFQVHMRVNGSFDRVGTLIEQVDEDFLDRYGYDSDGGDLYKLVQRSNLNPSFDDVTTGVEKKTGDKDDFSSLQALVDDLKLASSDQRIDRFYDNLDIPEFINYMAIRAIQQQADDVRKNFYVFKDVDGDGRWRIFPWDLDYTWDIVGGHGETRVDHPFFGIQAQPTADGANQWNRLYDVAFEDETMQRLMLRRLRTLMDQHLMATSTGSWFDQTIDALFEPMSSLPGPSNTYRVRLRDTELPERRSELFNDFTQAIPGMNVVIPDSQSGTPDVVIDEVDFSPASHDQDQEYIRLWNRESSEVDISGWSISHGVEFVFPAGTVIPRNGYLYVSPKLKKFASRSVSPKAGERCLVTGPYAGHLSSFGEELVLSDAAAGEVQRFTYQGAPSLAQQYLLLTELHYAPGVNPDAEFIELWNSSSSETIDLTGVHFTAGVDFDFTTADITTLEPGQRLLVVKDSLAFASIYGDYFNARIAGEFANGTSLNNGGERLKLEDATNSTIFEFRYDNQSPWPDAGGSSLSYDHGFGLGPAQVTDYSDPSNWVVTPGEEGSPLGYGPLFDSWLAARGQSDPLEEDGGWSALMSYALGRDLLGGEAVYRVAVESLTDDGSGGFEVVVGGASEEADRYLTMEISARSCFDMDLDIEVSSNMEDWQSAADLEILEQYESDHGVWVYKYRVGGALGPGEKRFARLAAQKKE